ncbi:hypothetical protein TPB0596_12420 [Tsukamurella pulmonis]|uniref:hypothetical protein n=1 Tax=Tsukamurella pulmonis TaxID=47312 RepID=UPI001EDEEE30|nr:hypothetical protein [Tsukamurella pulmonis]BDD81479.1 hypothetical protein TPB0596_12420 [Tsukamurella pulmonis]
MPCSACGQGRPQRIVHVVRWPATGRVRKYPTEAEAREVAEQTGGQYEQGRE